MPNTLVRLLVKNTSLNLLAYLYLLIASFISIPLLTRGLGELAFAQFLLLSSLPPLLSVFDLGISQAVIRTLSQGKESTRLTRVSLGFFLMNGLLLALVSLLVMWGMSRLPLFSTMPLGFNLRAILAASIFLNQILTHLLAVAQAEQRFDLYNLKALLVGTANTFLAGWIAATGRGLGQIFLLLFFSYLLTFVLTAYFLDRGASLRRPAFDLRLLRPLLRYGLRLFVGKVSGQVELHTAKYILASTLSAAAVSAFAIPQLIMYRAAGAVTQCALALFPLSSRLADPSRRSRLRSLYYRLQGSILLLSLVGVWLAHSLGGIFLLWWLGEPLAAATLPLLQLLSYFFVLLAMTPLASTVVDSLGYPQYTSVSALVTAALNLIFLVLLTPRYGAMGAGYALLMAFGITTPVFLFLTEKLLQANKLKY